MLHAHIVNQLLRKAIYGEPSLRFWSEWQEAIWLLLWVSSAGTLAGTSVRSPLVFISVVAACLGILAGAFWLSMLSNTVAAQTRPAARERDAGPAVVKPADWRASRAKSSARMPRQAATTEMNTSGERTLVPARVADDTPQEQPNGFPAIRSKSERGLAVYRPSQQLLTMWACNIRPRIDAHRRPQVSFKLGAMARRRRPFLDVFDVILPARASRRE